MRLQTRLFVLLLVATLVPAALRADDPAWIVRGEAGIVASDSPEASQCGAEILRAGGNAFDAAVATSFALAVARPQSTGLGGGGFMVAYIAAEKRFVALDFREMAPGGVSLEHYTELHNQNPQGPSASIYGGNAVGVPGQVAGLAEINKRFGSKPLAELTRPAIRLAEEGFVVDQSFLDARDETFDALKKWPQLDFPLRSIKNLLTPGGQALRAGERFKRPDLATTLQLIAGQGHRIFYDGPVAEAIIKAVNATGGVMLPVDLKKYHVIERKPLHVDFTPIGGNDAYEFVTMPPPSSGGICIAETLRIMMACGLRSDLDPKVYSEHVLVESMKHAFADRARWLGDADFASVPVSGLISPKYCAELARRIKTKTRPFNEYGSLTAPPDDHGTSHFCVADRFGNVVAQTETVNGSFGSLIVVEPYGVILNNQMDDFTTVRGVSNLFGLTQSEANVVAPGKRPLSSMSPTIIMKDGKPVLTLGASGGPRIITSTLQVALYVLDGKSLEEAMQAVRIHHQWQPDEVRFDQTPPSDLVHRLETCGHTLSDKRTTGVVQAIQFLPDGSRLGASDARKGGRPAKE